MRFNESPVIHRRDWLGERGPNVGYLRSVPLWRRRLSVVQRPLSGPMLTINSGDIAP